ncbi:response regulator [Mesorhizobium sp. NBSH29]|nr:response regulator [Mesorhizobium sp. NBSH29]
MPKNGSASQILIAGTSPINRIVVSKIAERAGLRSQSEAPEDALSAFEDLRPALVIADGGSSNSDCDGLLAGLKDIRLRSNASAPAVIFLCTAASDAAQLASLHGVDAVVAKPITPEGLQPVIERLVMRYLSRA